MYPLYTARDTAFDDISATTLADVTGIGQVMDFGIRPLWQPMP